MHSACFWLRSGVQLRAAIRPVLKWFLRLGFDVSRVRARAYLGEVVGLARRWPNVDFLLTAVVDVGLPGEHYWRLLDGGQRFDGGAASALALGFER